MGSIVELMGLVHVRAIRDIHYRIEDEPSSVSKTILLHLISNSKKIHDFLVLLITMAHLTFLDEFFLESSQ